MGYFDGLADGLFKKDVSGNTLFYPWGIMGAGFILDSEERKIQIRRFCKRTYMVLLAAVVVFQVAVGFWFNLVLLPVYYIWYFLMVKKLTGGLQKTDVRLKISESYKNSAKSHSFPILIFLELLSLTFMVMGIVLLQKVDKNFFISI